MDKEQKEGAKAKTTKTFCERRGPATSGKEKKHSLPDVSRAYSKGSRTYKLETSRSPSSVKHTFQHQREDDDSPEHLSSDYLLPCSTLLSNFERRSSASNCRSIWSGLLLRTGDPRSFDPEKMERSARNMAHKKSYIASRPTHRVTTVGV